MPARRPATASSSSSQAHHGTPVSPAVSLELVADVGLGAAATAGAVAVVVAGAVVVAVAVAVAVAVDVLVDVLVAVAVAVLVAVSVAVSVLVSVFVVPAGAEVVVAAVEPALPAPPSVELTRDELPLPDAADVADVGPDRDGTESELVGSATEPVGEGRDGVSPEPACEHETVIIAIAATATDSTHRFRSSGRWARRLTGMISSSAWHCLTLHHPHGCCVIPAE
jgi:hypothetical protein